ncbi:hypothetical protein ID866_13382 [Astraeus odoratus]|nr:hypothetical protein ID866_13382 [Astraeus odoratus]
MKPSGIQCVLLDDGLSGVADLAEGYKWHDQLTVSPTKRIVRIEFVAQNILLDLVPSMQCEVNPSTIGNILAAFTDQFQASITASAGDAEVVGFKSVACYRTGLDITTSGTTEEIESSLLDAWNQYKERGNLRFEHKALNDYLVRIVLRIAGQCKKPVQFHTGIT